MPVLATKVRVPSPRRRLVPRDRLVVRLRADVEVPRLVLLAAPAGFGKTTLMTQWLTAAASQQHRVAWLALDAADGDLRTFLTHLMTAVGVADADADAELRAVREAGDAVSTDEVLIGLVAALDVIDGPTIVALDDYHVVDDAEVHEAVASLLEDLPPQVTVAISTRSDPPLPLSRLRARGELLEVRAADLRFTAEEAGEFLNDVMGLDLATELVAALESRTEGWAAGLQLAALSARARSVDGGGIGDVAGFVEAFSGSHRFVLDYLVEEVLDRQPEALRAFLFDTCLLDQMSGDLCDALTGRADGSATLDFLERNHLFVVPLDDDRTWYRYHHLFAEALRVRAAERDPEHRRALHGAASTWFAEHGLLDDAVRHATEAGDHARAADLVELGLADLRRRRQDRTIRRWLSALPDEVARRRPLVAAAVAWSRLAVGDIDAVEPWLDAAEARLDGVGELIVPTTGALGGAATDREEELRSVPAMIEVYRASVAQARGDVDGTIEHARRAMAQVGEADHFARGAASGFLGLAAWASGDLPNAVATFGEAVRSLRSAGMVADELGASVVLADMWSALGRPEEARRLQEEALAFAEAVGHVLSTTGDLHVRLAEVLREQGELEEAAEHLEVARALGDRASLPENRHRWFTTMAGLRRAAGDLDGVLAMLAEAERRYLPGYFPDVRPIAATAAQVQLARGRLDRARAWATEQDVDGSGPVSYRDEHHHLTLARLLVAEGDAADAIQLVDRVVDDARSAGRDGSVVEALVVRALAQHAVGDEDAARSDLGAALRLGASAGHRRLFLDEGASMVELLGDVARSAASEERDLAAQVLAAERSGDTPASISSSTPSVPAEGLTDREMEVLRLLASELTGPEIARHLFVSVNTLRTHTRHIFTKLGVTTRRAAVRKASELGLL